MAQLRDLPLVDASVQETVEFGEAVARLFQAQVPAVAVVDRERRLVGVFSERDVLRAIFPAYLAEVRHTAFLTVDASALDDLATEVRHKPAGRFARVVEVLEAEDSDVHAAERFLHSDEQALPVVDGDRFLGMLSIAALCHARLDGPASA